MINILSVMAAAVALFSACSKGGDRVIPRGTLAEIYAEMLMVDQWIASTPSVRKIADTSLVYTPIIQSYGYTADDYRKSVDHYMKDPERYSRILRTTSDILGKRLAVLKGEQARLARIAAVPVFKLEYYPEDFAPYLKDAKVVYSDSLSVEPDSATFSYSIAFHETADTVYDGLVMVVRLDTLAVVDSLACQELSVDVDSLAVADTVELKDSITSFVKAELKPEFKELKLAEDTLIGKRKPMRGIPKSKVKVEKLKVSEDKK